LIAAWFISSTYQKRQEIERKLAEEEIKKFDKALLSMDGSIGGAILDCQSIFWSMNSV
jgi:hypothetical protein